MPLPVNIDELLRGNTIESERIEYKKSWNPKDVLHTMCAFANDMHNWGGGYIIIGVEEVDGKAILPPIGIHANQIDLFQKNVVELGHKIAPNYFPMMSPYSISEKLILVIWCPAGDNRPYTAPISLGDNKKRERISYIRVGSETKKVNNEQQRRLFELAARIPFDDRVNNNATLEDLDLGLMRTYLYEVKSQLYKESARASVKDLAINMLIAKGPEEDIKPINVGLMFFSKDPEKFFPGSRIEIVIHKDRTGRNFEEIYFQGPIHNQLRNALAFIKNQVIKEHVIKRADVAEADRFFNYPYQAIEEVLANAVYHRSYEKREPIEVQIWEDRIEVLSFPGPVPPVDYDTLKSLNERKRIIAREYRNRRVGDFLKELDLTEGRSTGFPTIYEALASNGSPNPSFETDKDLNYFLSVIYARQAEGSSSTDKELSSADKELSSAGKELSSTDKALSSAGRSDTVSKNDVVIIRELLGERTPDKEILELAILYVCSFGAKDLKEIANYLNRNERYLYSSYVLPMINNGLLSREYKDATHPSQRYLLTSQGKEILKKAEELLMLESKNKKID